MPGEDVPRLAPNHHPRRRMELVIGEDPELRLVRLFPIKRSTTIDIGIKAHLAGAWGTAP